MRVIYDAVREVDESLSAINFAGERLESQGVAADSSLRAWNFSQESFMVGAADYMVVLDTQRTYQRNLDDWYIARFDRYRSLINLFSALGGGIPGHDSMLPQGATIASPAKGLGNVDWAGNSLHGSPWLVEISGLYDRGAVLSAWRSLHTRFPHQIEKKTLLPQRQGQVVSASKERSSWYRLFIATFSDKKIAEGFCAALRAGQQRCDVMSSQSLEGKGDFVLPLIDEKASIKNTVEEPVGKMAGLDKNISNYQLSNQADMVQVKEERQSQVEAKESADAQTLAENQAQKITRPVDEARESLAISPEILVDRWMKDWSSKKVDSYLSHYDIEFMPKNEKDRETWEAKRRHRINEAATIKVSAKKLKIKRQSELRATASFIETVEVGNYKKISQKELLLIRRDGNGEWKIREELELSR